MSLVHRLFLFVLIVGVFGTAASATPPIFKQYVKLYGDSSAEYGKAVKKAKCFICHQGKKKKNQNVYGVALAEHLGKKDKDVEKIIAALKLIADQSSDSEVEDAPTFGELIAEEKLPGGTLEDSKKEPADSTNENEAKEEVEEEKED